MAYRRESAWKGFCVSKKGSADLVQTSRDFVYQEQGTLDVDRVRCPRTAIVKEPDKGSRRSRLLDVRHFCDPSEETVMNFFPCFVT
jgi:hypothetical protein